jgi:hypothetical protein
MKQSFVIKTSVGEYSANIEKEVLFSLIEKKEAGETVNIPLGEGTSYLEGNEYTDNAVLTLFPSVELLAVIEHNLKEKEKIDLNSK